MKTYPFRLTLLIALALAFMGCARAGEGKVKTLDDKQMASIEGGFCLYWKCQDGTGTGSCQPINNDTVDLCAKVKCSLNIDMEGNTEVLQCQINNEAVTCSQAGTYIQCVRSKIPTICVSDLNSTDCGELVQTYCFPDIKHRRCLCDSGTDTTPCDWTSCLN